jgi:flagellar assembly protein FliH
MSSKARRVERTAGFEAVRWRGDASGAAETATPEPPGPSAGRPIPPATAPDLSALERDAFTKGYAQGERAGNEAAGARAEAMLRRLAQTLDELQAFRTEMIQRTERQVVELALAIARKVVQREVSLDSELMLAMARVALDRLGDAATATIRLHPDDYAAAASGRAQAGGSGHGVEIVSDPAVRRGGCVVRSEFGSIDVAVDAQIDELTRALLGDEVAVPAPLSHPDDVRSRA